MKNNCDTSYSMVVFSTIISTCIKNSKLTSSLAKTKCRPNSYSKCLCYFLGDEQRGNAIPCGCICIQWPVIYLAEPYIACACTPVDPSLPQFCSSIKFPQSFSPLQNLSSSIHLPSGSPGQRREPWRQAVTMETRYANK